MINNLIMFNPGLFLIIIGLIQLIVIGTIMFFVGRKYQKHRGPTTEKELRAEVEKLEWFKWAYFVLKAKIKAATMALIDPPQEHEVPTTTHPTRKASK